MEQCSKDGDEMKWINSIKLNYKKLSPAEKKAADFILNEYTKQDLSLLTLRQCALKSGVGQQTIIRCLEKCGFSSWKHFGRCICGEQSIMQEDAENKLRLDMVPSCTAKKAMQVLTDLTYNIDMNDFKSLIKALRSARMIDIYGVECSVGSAIDLAGKLLYLGMNCRTYTDVFFQKVSAEYLSYRDVAIGISQSGQSRVTVEALLSAKASGAFTVAVTDNRNSKITEGADLVFVLPNINQETGWMNSRVGQIVFNDMIYQALLLKDEGYKENVVKSSKSVLNDIL